MFEQIKFLQEFNEERQEQIKNFNSTKRVKDEMCPEDIETYSNVSSVSLQGIQGGKQLDWLPLDIMKSVLTKEEEFEQVQNKIAWLKYQQEKGIQLPIESQNVFEFINHFKSMKDLEKKIMNAQKEDIIVSRVYTPISQMQEEEDQQLTPEKLEMNKESTKPDRDT